MRTNPSQHRIKADRTSRRDAGSTSTQCRPRDVRTLGQVRHPRLKQGVFNNLQKNYRDTLPETPRRDGSDEGPHQYPYGETEDERKNANTNTPRRIIISKFEQYLVMKT